MYTATLGEKLRRARTEQGLAIAELELRTRIAGKFLEALESDRRDLIPAGFFFKHWAVQYASALSLDRSDIENDVNRILSSEAPLPLPGQGGRDVRARSGLHQSVHRRSGTSPLLASIGVLFLVVFGCSGFYSWWHKKTQSSNASTVSVPLEPPPSFVADVKPAYPVQPRPAPAATMKVEKQVVGPRVVKIKSPQPLKRVRAKRARRAHRHPPKPENPVITTAFRSAQ